MNKPELEQKIRDYIKELYKAEYNGSLFEVDEINSIYTFTIGLPSYMQPTTISCEADNDGDFLLYIKEELRTRNYMRLYIYKVVKQEDA